MIEKFKPFENNTQSIEVGPNPGLTFENGKEEITVYGDLTITKETKAKDLDSLIVLLQKIQAQLK